MSEPVVLSLEPELESVDTVHEALEDFWTSHDSVSALDRIRFETGVIEILGNIIEHSFRAGSRADGRRLQVSLHADGDTLVAVLGDNGLPAAIDLSAVAMPDEEAESGRGLALALAALDDLTYERVDARNRWTLLCRRAAS